MNGLERELRSRMADEGTRNFTKFLSEKVGITYPTWHGIAEKSHGYSTETISKLANYLKLKPSEVIALIETE